VELEPARAFAGEQVVWRARILRRDDVRQVDWGRPPAFPGFRVEALPSLASDTPEWREGRRYEGFEERRALFALHAGEIAIPAASLRCRPPGAGAEQEREVLLPGARLEVRELPRPGRPTPFSGAVGALSVEASLAPGELALGGSARLSILVEGEADLFGLPPPFDPGASASADLEILEQPPELARDAGRRLRLRRWYRYDLVPRRAGRFELPPVEVDFFDPVGERYAVAAAPPLRLAVREAAGAEPGRRAGAEAQPHGAPSRPGTGIVASLAAAALAAGAAAFAWRRRARRREPGRGARDALARAAAARSAGGCEAENAALARALRLALEAAGLPGARSGSSEEILAATAHDAELCAAAQLLVRLDRARFAGEADAAPGAEGVASVVRRLLEREPAP
jgi:hypothetical protein